MNNLITVSFRNDKILKNENLVSANEFSVKSISANDRRICAQVDLKTTEEFDEFVNALSGYIIKKYEPKLLKKTIKDVYPEIPDFTVNEIVKTKKDDDTAERKRVVGSILKDYFSKNDNGSIEGLVTFRLSEYKKMLYSLSEELVDEYYLTREYEDFLELLRYFISVQEIRPEKVYVCVNKYGMYGVLNEAREDITNRCAAEFLRGDEVRAENFDDLLISILITLAPKKIIVQNSENIKNKQLFETIESVFEKVEYE